MTNRPKPRQADRLGDQDLFQNLISQLSRLRIADGTIGDVTIPEVQASLDLIVAELQTQNTHLSVLATEAPKQTQALQDCLLAIQQTYTAEGGAGLLVTQDAAVSKTITNAWTVLDNWDDKMLPEQDASADVGTGLITIQTTGIWAVSCNFVLDILSSNANETRYLEIAVYNTIDLMPIIIGSVSIPRYGDRATLAAWAKFNVDTGDVGEALGLAVRTPVGTSDVVVTDIDAGAQYSVGRQLTAPPP